MSISIKICGLTDPQAVRAVIDAQVDYAGFVYFPKSPRHTELPRAKELASALPATIKSVSVLVDPDNALLTQVKSLFAPYFVQLHGKETPQRVAEIRSRFPAFKIIKAVSVRCSDDIASALAYVPHADMLMFDAKPPETPGMLPGGNGLSFDWALFKGREFPLPWFLSGGLSSENVLEAIRLTGAKMVDVSSGVESAPGVKDPAFIDAFVKAIRSA